jgi:hypothetical protein
MKKASYLLNTIAILMGVILFTACQPEEEGYVWETVYTDGSVEANPHYSKIDVNSPSFGFTCPKSGTTCKKIPVQNNPVRKAMFDDFKIRYQNNDLQYYFDNRAYFEQLFPSLTYQKDLMDKLQNGTYKLVLVKDNAVIIYRNNELTLDNIVYTILIEG